LIGSLASPFVLHFPSELIFSGLPSNYRLVVHQNIFDLIHFGKGFTWDDAYNLPVFIRTFYLKSIEKIVKAKHKAQEKASKSIKRPSLPKRR
jgi:hypothetical protein